MRRIGQFWGILIATLLVAQQPPAGAQRDRIQGVVIDAETHQPLGGAKVLATLVDGSDAEMTADPTGHFELDRPSKRRVEYYGNIRWIPKRWSACDGRAS